MIRALIYAAILRPLILRDYRLRAEGKRSDQWYWADQLAVNWGFFTMLPEAPTNPTRGE